MKEKNAVSTAAIDIEQLEKELERERFRVSRRTLAIGLMCALAVIALLITTAVHLLPVYRIHGSSMSPTVEAGDVIVCAAGSSYDVGDIVALEYDGRILVKRLVAREGDQVMIDEKGILHVNGNPVDEPYVSNRTSGRDTATAIYTVPSGEWYILGDNRAISGDSRLAEMGSIEDHCIIGRVIFRLLPIGGAGTIE